MTRSGAGDKVNENKVYLGDSVYAEYEVLFDCGRIKLTTENGIETTNTIYLEPEILEELQNFWRVRNE